MFVQRRLRAATRLDLSRVGEADSLLPKPQNKVVATDQAATKKQLYYTHRPIWTAHQTPRAGDLRSPRSSPAMTHHCRNGANHPPAVPV